MLHTYNKVRSIVAIGLLTVGWSPAFSMPQSEENKKVVITENIDSVAKTLQYLAQYEIDGSFLLEQAIASIRNAALKEKLLKIREECEGNIRELSDLIRSYGREAPSHSRDFKGFFMQGYVGMRGLISDQGAMKALHTNLEMLTRAFEKALKSDFPSETRMKINKIYQNAKAHLEYIATQM